MKCDYCGAEFTGKSCPGCGAVADNGELKTPSPVNPESTNELKKPLYKRRWFVVLLIVVIGAIVGGSAGAVVIGILGGNKSGGLNWSKVKLSEFLPEPAADKFKILENTDERLWLELYEIADDKYGSYVSACKNNGFTVDRYEAPDSYLAYNESGYGLELSLRGGTMTVILEAPMEFTAIEWPSGTVGELLPVPDSLTGKFLYSNSNGFSVYIGNTTKDGFDKYAAACSDNGFNLNTDKGDTYYYADNSAGYRLSLKYKGNNTMSIVIGLPDSEPGNPESPKPVSSSTTDSSVNNNNTNEGTLPMEKNIFSDDYVTDKELVITPGDRIADVAARISAQVSEEAINKGNAFAREITDRYVGDFEKSIDRMAHVSTFLVIKDVVYVSYYANTKEPSEDPKNQTARLAYAPVSNPNDKTIIDLQTAGDKIGGKTVDMVYDTILMQKDDNTIYIMWTARVEENYYRFYCPFTLSTKKLGEIAVNRFKVGNIVNDFSVSGIRSALSANDVPCKRMYSDIGIMQKLSSRVENGETYYYSGAYSGDFNCIIKSKDLITWEYVSQPDFVNGSKWENAVYVLGNKCYYFVRQQDFNECGFLTAYDLETNTWAKPVEIEDCQSRSDFIFYKGGLYLFHAPIDREHIGIIKIDTENLAGSSVVLQAKMFTSCFYPYVQYYRNGELAMSYTVSRQHIRLAQFTLSKYL